jgi:hypothetical protein
MKTKLKEMMDWFTALNKDKVQFKITSEHHHTLLWGFAIATQRRERTFVLTNGSFRFFWGTKTEAGFVDVDVTFDNERCFMRLVTKETKTEEVITPELKGIEA